MKNLISTVKNEKGQGMVEYGIIVALVALVAILALSTFGENIRDAFTNTNAQMNTTAGGGAGGDAGDAGDGGGGDGG